MSAKLKTKPKTKPNEAGEYPVQTRVDRQTILKLEKLADLQTRSVASFLRVLILKATNNAS